jgi:hypothetical protein
MSASVELVGLWIGYGEDFATQLNFNAAVDIRPRLKINGRTDIMANGDSLSISEPGSQRVYDVSIGLQDRTNREAIVALAGQPIEVRTGRGDLVFGVFWSPVYPFLSGTDLSDVGFVLEETTYSIEV